MFRESVLFRIANVVFLTERYNVTRHVVCKACATQTNSTALCTVYLQPLSTRDSATFFVTFYPTILKVGISVLQLKSLAKLAYGWRKDWKLAPSYSCKYQFNLNTLADSKLASNCTCDCIWPDIAFWSSINFWYEVKTKREIGLTWKWEKLLVPSVLAPLGFRSVSGFRFETGLDFPTIANTPASSSNQINSFQPSQATLWVLFLLFYKGIQNYAPWNVWKNFDFQLSCSIIMFSNLTLKALQFDDGSRYFFSRDNNCWLISFKKV